MTEADLVKYARNYSGLRPKDDYVNLPYEPNPLVRRTRRFW